MGKEDIDSLQSLKIYNDEIKKLETDEIKVHVGGNTHTMKLKIASHMLDGKAAKIYNGLGGAYCDLCQLPKVDSNDLEIIEAGFSIDRTKSDIDNFFDDPDNIDEDGNIVKRVNDYLIRLGITQKPIAEHMVLSTQVLHTLLRTFDHFMEVVVHMKAAVFSWSASSWQKTFLKNAKV